MAVGGEVRFELNGAQGIERVLKLLPERIAQKELEKALRKGAVLVRREARMRVPQRGKSRGYATGQMKRAITVGTRKRGGKKGSKRFAGVVFLGMATTRSPLFHLVEFGTGPRYHKESGKFVGQAPAQPFMRPALDGKGQEAIQVIGTTLWANLEKTANQLAGRYGNLTKFQRRHL